MADNSTSYFDQDILNKMSAIDAWLVVCLNMAEIVSVLRQIPPNFKGLPVNLIEANFRRLVVIINATIAEYLKRCDSLQNQLQSVHGKEVVRLGGFTGTCYAELTFAVAKRAYLWLMPRPPHPFDERFTAYLNGGSQGPPPPLDADEVWEEWSKDRRISEGLFPEGLRSGALPDFDELRNYLRQEFAVVRDSLAAKKNGEAAATPLGIDLTPEILRTLRGDESILLTGDTGVGKEFHARQIHAASTRSKEPFVAVNCAMLPKERIDSQLFGHVPGAYTDAKQARPGYARDAEQGTLFLDELDKLPPECFGNLLRFAQDKVIQPLGGASKTVDVRIMAASNAPRVLSEELLYRFEVIFRIRPLSERRSEIVALADQFFKVAKKTPGRSSLRFTEDEQRRLADDPYRWPGNIRQLEKATRLAVRTAVGAKNLTASMILAAARHFDNSG